MPNTAKFSVSFNFRHMDATDAIKSYAREKSEKLGKYFHGQTQVEWHFSVEKLNHTAHCHIVGNSNEVNFNAEAVTTDLYASIEQAIEKLEKQLRKHKERVKNHLHRERQTG